jgi:hypothetical protein
LEWNNLLSYFLMILMGICVIYIFILGLKMYFRGMQNLKLKRGIENIPTSKVRGLAIGPAELYGETREVKTDKKGDETKMIAPFSQRPCVYYSLEIRKWTRGITLESIWKTIYTEERRVPFNLKDETGEILINPADARVELEKETVIYETKGGKDRSGKEIPEHIIDYANKKSIKHYDFFKGEFLFTEKAIYLNKQIYVQGSAQHIENEAKSSKGHENLVIKKVNDMIMLIHDVPEKDIIQKMDKQLLKDIYGGAVLSASMFVLIISVILGIVL